MWWTAAFFVYVIGTVVLVAAMARDNARKYEQTQIDMEDLEEAFMGGVVLAWPIVLAVAPFFLLAFGVSWLAGQILIKIINIKPISPKPDKLARDIADAREHLRALEAEAALPQKELNDAAWRQHQSDNA